jgi:hypothetical protein
MRLLKPPIGGDDESAHGSPVEQIKSSYFNDLYGSQLARQQQDDERDQNHATGMLEP